MSIGEQMQKEMQLLLKAILPVSIFNPNDSNANDNAAEPDAIDKGLDAFLALAEKARARLLEKSLADRTAAAASEASGDHSPAQLEGEIKKLRATIARLDALMLKAQTRMAGWRQVLKATHAQDGQSGEGAV